VQSQRIIVTLKSTTEQKHSDKTKELFACPPNVSQSFELQRPDIESCRAEVMLRLSLSIVLRYKNMQPFETRDQELWLPDHLKFFQGHFVFQEIRTALIGVRR